MTFIDKTPAMAMRHLDRLLAKCGGDKARVGVLRSIVMQLHMQVHRERARAEKMRAAVQVESEN